MPVGLVIENPSNSFVFPGMGIAMIGFIDPNIYPFVPFASSFCCGYTLGGATPPPTPNPTLITGTTPKSTYRRTN